MKKPRFYLSYIIPFALLALGGTHWFIMMRYSQPANWFLPAWGNILLTGLVVLGVLLCALSVWQIGPKGISALRQKSMLAAVLCFAAAAVSLARAVVLVVYAIKSNFDILQIIIALLFVFCALWVGLLGLHFLLAKSTSPTKTPFLAFWAVAPFCIEGLLLVLRNPATTQHITNTIHILAIVSLIIWLATIVKGLYVGLPMGRMRMAYIFGLIAFMLATCFDSFRIYAALVSVEGALPQIMECAVIVLFGLVAGSTSVVIAVNGREPVHLGESQDDFLFKMDDTPLVEPEQLVAFKAEEQETVQVATAQPLEEVGNDESLEFFNKLLNPEKISEEDVAAKEKLFRYTEQFMAIKIDDEPEKNSPPKEDFKPQVVPKEESKVTQQAVGQVAPPTTGNINFSVPNLEKNIESHQNIFDIFNEQNQDEPQNLSTFDLFGENQAVENIDFSPENYTAPQQDFQPLAGYPAQNDYAQPQNNQNGGSNVFGLFGENQTGINAEYPAENYTAPQQDFQPPAGYPAQNDYAQPQNNQNGGGNVFGLFGENQTGINVEYPAENYTAPQQDFQPPAGYPAQNDYAQPQNNQNGGGNVFDLFGENQTGINVEYPAENYTAPQQDFQPPAGYPAQNDYAQPQNNQNGGSNVFGLFGENQTGINAEYPAENYTAPQQDFQPPAGYPAQNDYAQPQNNQNGGGNVFGLFGENQTGINVEYPAENYTAPQQDFQPPAGYPAQNDYAQPQNNQNGGGNVFDLFGENQTGINVEYPAENYTAPQQDFQPPAGYPAQNDYAQPQNNQNGEGNIFDLFSGEHGSASTISASQKQEYDIFESEAPQTTAFSHTEVNMRVEEILAGLNGDTYDYSERAPLKTLPKVAQQKTSKKTASQNGKKQIFKKKK